MFVRIFHRTISRRLFSARVFSYLVSDHSFLHWYSTAGRTKIMGH